MTKCNFFKFWWNDNLQTLKEESLAAHRLWIDCGKPRHGAVFEIAKKNAKAKMRAIKQEYSDYVVSVFALVIYYIHLQEKN